MTTPDQVRAHFQARAARYDTWMARFAGEQELRVIRKLVPAGSQVLDYGCGTGRTTLDLLARACRVTAYDLSPAMLAQAQIKAERRGYEAEFVTDTSALRGRTWSIVTCIGVLDYVPRPVPFLRRLGGFLAPGGRLVITYPNATSVLCWTYLLASQWTVPATAHTSWFAARAAAQAGFRVECLRYALPSLAGVGHTLVLALRAAE